MDVQRIALDEARGGAFEVVFGIRKSSTIIKCVLWVAIFQYILRHQLNSKVRRYLVPWINIRLPFNESETETAGRS